MHLVLKGSVLEQVGEEDRVNELVLFCRENGHSNEGHGGDGVHEYLK